MTAVPYSSIISSQSNNSAINTNTSQTVSDTSTPPYSVPFTVSLLISESLFPHHYSPVNTIIIPFIRVELPYAYFIIILMELFTAYLAKLSLGPSYSILSLYSGTALPDLEAFRQARPTTESIQRNQSGRISTLDVNNRADQEQSIESTPLLPLGMTFNLSFLSPFTAPTSTTSTLFTIQLKEIKNIPGYVLPLVALVLYLILRPVFHQDNSSNN